jgi:hypothetical protein
MKTKTVKLALGGFGSYLGMEKGCFVVKHQNREIERYPLFENQISEVQIKSACGNSFPIARVCAAFLDTDAFIVYYITERILLGNAIE